MADAGALTTPEFSPEGLTSLASEISDLDTQIAAAGGEKQSLRAVKEKLATDNADAAAATVTDLINQLKGKDAGFLTAFTKQFNTAMGSDIQPVIDEAVKKIVADTATPTGDVSGMKETRKAKAEMFKLIKKTMLVAFSKTPDILAKVEAVADPKRSGGGRKPGSVKVRNVRFYVDGSKIGDSQNNPSAIAFKVLNGLKEADKKTGGPGYAKYLKTLVGKEDLWDAPWSVEVKNGDKTYKVEARVEVQEPAQSPAA